MDNHSNMQNFNENIKDVLLVGGRLKDKNIKYREALEFVGLSSDTVTPDDFPSDFFQWDIKGLEERIKKYKGVLISGGGDIDPYLYMGEKEVVSPKNAFVDIGRDLLEKKIFEIILPLNIPIFGICRGIQVLNWVLGGDLYQDIDDQFPPCKEEKHHQQKHRGIPRDEPSHRVLLEKGSLIYNIIEKESIEVNSLHHQAVRSIGKGLKITGKSTDGVVEVIEMPQRLAFLLVVQFHPEEMIYKCEDMKKLFDRFALEVKGL